ncbi:MAG: TonB-dependent receptor plug domain-containing protein, partial [Planctomycetota bacterium]
QFISARVGKMLSDNFSVYATVSYYSDDSDSVLAHFREFYLKDGSVINVEGDEENGVNMVLKAKYKWFKLSFHKSRHDTLAPLSTFSIIGGDDSRFVTDRHIIRLSFEKMLFTGFELNASFDYDDYRFDDGTAYEDNPGATNQAEPATGKDALGNAGRFLRKMAAVDRRYEFKVQATYLPTPNIQALAGVELEYLDLLRWHFPEVWEASNLKLPEFDNLHLGTFLQGQYSPIEMLGLTAGVRFDYAQIYGSVATPRAGVVVRLPVGFYAKGLFGTAYKAPSFHDLYYFRKNAFYGNPNLDPERSITGEGQIGYRMAGRLDVRLTGFYTSMSNLIGYGKTSTLASPGDFPETQRPDAGKDVSQKINKADARTAGFEAEIMIRPIDRIWFRLQGTYRKPEALVKNATTGKEEWKRLDYSSEWTMGGSITLRVTPKLHATFRGLGIGDKKVPLRALSEPGYRQWAPEYDPTIDAPPYFVGTFVLRADDVFRKGVSLFLKLDNISNQEYWDAGRELLYPQRKFQGMVWARMAL